MKQVLVIYFALVAFVIFGCSKNDNYHLVMKPVKADSIDADKNGKIEENDIFILYDLSDQLYDSKIKPYLAKAGIEDKAELYNKDASFRLRSKLTVLEWETFTRNIEEWSKVNAQIEATAKEITDKVVEEKLVSGSAKVIFCHVWGNIELADGRVLKYASIRIPVGGTENNFARITNLLSKKFIEGRLIKYELSGKSLGNSAEAYIYVNKVCINEELAKMGYALAVRDGSDTSQKYIQLEEEAKQYKRGLWAYYPDQNPFAEPLY